MVNLNSTTVIATWISSRSTLRQSSKYEKRSGDFMIFFHKRDGAADKTIDDKYIIHLFLELNKLLLYFNT